MIPQQNLSVMMYRDVLMCRTGMCQCRERTTPGMEEVDRVWNRRSRTRKSGPWEAQGCGKVVQRRRPTRTWEGRSRVWNSGREQLPGWRRYDPHDSRDGGGSLRQEQAVEGCGEVVPCLEQRPRSRLEPAVEDARSAAGADAA
jgi:hypothetical protein